MSNLRLGTLQAHGIHGVQLHPSGVVIAIDGGVNTNVSAMTYTEFKTYLGY